VSSKLVIENMLPTSETEQILQTAFQLSNQDRASEVATLLVRVLDTPWPLEPCRDFLGRAYDLACRALLASHGQSDQGKEAVRQLCGESHKRYGRQPWNDLYEGALLHLQGKHDEAVQLYRAAGSDASVLLPLSNGCKTVLTLGETRALASNANGGIGEQDSKIILENIGAPTGSVVIFVAADHTYLMRHGDTFFRSVQAHGEGLSAHLHLVNPQVEDFTFIEHGIRSGCWPPLNLSTEAYFGPDHRAYFASVRLIRAPLMLELYRRPLVISDIDIVYEESVLPVLPLLTSFDVGLFFKNNKYRYRSHPWQAIRAGILMYAPTPEGRSFSETVALLTHRAFERYKGNEIWFIDQNLLYHAWLLSRVEQWKLKIADLACPVLGSIHRVGATGFSFNSNPAARRTTIAPSSPRPLL
jgi:hypothetical protein